MQFADIYMTLRQAVALVKAAVSSWVEDYAQSMGAALAYYTIFSIAPLLLIVISVAGLFFGEDAARGEIFEQLQGMIGAQGAEAIQELLRSVNQPKQSIAATIIGVVVLMIGATTVFAELQSAMDRVWRVPRKDQPSGIWKLVSTRLLSISLILGIGFLLIVSLVASAALSALGRWWEPAFAGWTLLANVVNFLVSFGVITTIFAMIYKFMPRAKVGWEDVWVGAGVTALLFTIGKALIGLYIGKSGISSTFGAAGSLVVVLVWVYYSAQIFLMGAEFTWAYSHTFGSRKAEPMPCAAPAVPGEDDSSETQRHLAEVKSSSTVTKKPATNP